MHIKKYLLAFVSTILIFASFPIATLSEDRTEDDRKEITSNVGEYSTKDEVIYGKLDSNGTVQNMYVVNSFHITNPGNIKDFGSYTNVRNLTDLSDIDLNNNNEIHFTTMEEEFYYQGELENEPLPWDISMTYFLDGKKINPEQLAGKSGKLEIHIATAANDQVDQVFFENYLLQISVKFDPLIFHDIHAPKGIEANEGKNKLINFSVLPDQEELLIISTNVTNLQMEPIEISAIPAIIALEDPDMDEMTKEMKTLADAIRDLNNGVAKLRDGTLELADGTNELRKGSNEYLQGMSELNKSSNELISGSEEIVNALNHVSDALEDSPELPEIDLDDLKQLPKAFRDAAKRLHELADQFDEFEVAIDQLPDYEITEKQLKELEKALKETGVDTKVLEQLVETYNGAKRVIEATENMPDFLITFMKEMARNLETIADEIENNMESIEQLEELGDLQTGLATLSAEYKTFHNGLVDYTNGVGTLTSSYEEINEGIADISMGTSAVKRGIDDLRDGTTELHEATNDLPGQMQSEVDKLLEEFDFSDFEPTSFVSNKNKHIGVVQFVLRTKPIEVEEPDEPVEKVEEKKGIWARFLDLFK